MAMNREERLQAIRALKKKSPGDRVLLFSTAIFVTCCALSWFALDLGLTHPVTGKSRFHVQPRFVADVIPFPLRVKDEHGHIHGKWDSDLFLGWVQETWAEIGWSGVVETISISVLAIVLAAICAVFLVLPASRNVALRRGFLPADDEGSRWERGGRYGLFLLARSVLLLLRAIPEFVWAFLLLILLGPVAMAGVLALALHNAGILAKLTSESVEDLESKPLHALAGLGAGKLAVSLVGVGPRAYRQFLVYFFYRWETCIRETAILGILAIHTLGLHIDHAFAFFHYDKAVFFILVNSAIVIVGDFLGSFARRTIRKA